MPAKEERVRTASIWRHFGHLYLETPLSGRVADRVNFYCRICSGERQLLYPK
jgi:hypothetical protein